mgnify:CR=1 FL=1
MDGLVLLKSKYNALPQNDKRALLLLSAFFCVVALFYGVLKPIGETRVSAQNNHETRLKELRFLESNAHKAARITSSNSGNNSNQSDRSLLSIVNSSSSQFSVSLKTIEPSGDDKIKITLEAVPFNALMKWLDSLNTKNHVNTTNVFIERAKEEGLTNVRLTLSL